MVVDLDLILIIITGVSLILFRMDLDMLLGKVRRRRVEDACFTWD